MVLGGFGSFWVVPCFSNYAQISRKLVVFGYIVAGFGSLWLVLLVL